MDYFDLHCDTATELYRRREKLSRNSLHVSLEKAKGLGKYAQVAAFWSDPSHGDDECFDIFKKTLGYFLSELAENGLYPADCQEAFDRLVGAGKPAFILAVEGANLLGGDFSRLPLLYRLGVRIITPVWKGESCIGGGYDSDMGLTAFGREAVDMMGRLNIACDLSHSGPVTADDALSAAEKNGYPVFCSHSCSRGLCGHPRCISDGFARRLSDAGGICGVSFVPSHLTSDKICKAETVVSHIARLYDVAGADFPAVGGDFDGVDRLPDGISDLSCVGIIPHLLKKRGFGDDDVDRIMFGNAARFSASFLRKTKSFSA